MVEQEVEIVNRLGLHARAAAKLVQMAAQYDCEIALERNGEQVDAKSILGILMLAAAQGAKLTVRCEGSDEAAALAAITGLLAERFGEER